MSLVTGQKIHRHCWTPMPMPQEVIDLVSAMGAQQRMPLTLTFADRHGKIIKETLDNLAPADMPDSDDEDNDYHPGDDDDDSDHPDDHLNDDFVPDTDSPSHRSQPSQDSPISPHKLFPTPPSDSPALSPETQPPKITGMSTPP